MRYDSDEYYLDCHTYCDACDTPLINKDGACTSCLSSLYYYGKEEKCVVDCEDGSFAYLNTTDSENYCVLCDNEECNCYAEDLSACTGCLVDG